MYSKLQRQLIAKEFARAGGNAEAAAKALRLNYESFPKIGTSTILREKAKRGFTALVAEQSRVLSDAAAEASREVEIERARREQQGSILERIARDEERVERLFQAIESRLNDPNGRLEPVIKVWGELNDTVEKRRRDLLPAIAATAEASCLIQAVMEVLTARYGHGYAKEVIGAVRDRYTELQAARNGKDDGTDGADATHGTANRGAGEAGTRGTK